MALNGNGTHIHPSRSSRKAAQVLQCPECGRAMVLTEDNLFEGHELDCMHCSAALVLGREFDPDRQAYHWSLDPEDDVFGEDRDHE